MNEYVFAERILQRLEQIWQTAPKSQLLNRSGEASMHLRVLLPISNLRVLEELKLTRGQLTERTWIWNPNAQGTIFDRLLVFRSGPLLGGLIRGSSFFTGEWKDGALETNLRYSKIKWSGDGHAKFIQLCHTEMKILIAQVLTDDQWPKQQVSFMIEDMKRRGGQSIKTISGGLPEQNRARH